MSLSIKRWFGFRWFISRCRCGHVFHIPLFLFFFRDKVYRRCGCGEVYCYRLIYHIVSDSTDQKRVEENKIRKSKEIYKRC